MKVLTNSFSLLAGTGLIQSLLRKWIKEFKKDSFYLLVPTRVWIHWSTDFSTFVLDRTQVAPTSPNPWAMATIDLQFRGTIFWASLPNNRRVMHWWFITMIVLLVSTNPTPNLKNGCSHRAKFKWFLMYCFSPLLLLEIELEL